MRRRIDVVGYFVDSLFFIFIRTPRPLPQAAQFDQSHIGRASLHPQEGAFDIPPQRLGDSQTITAGVSLYHYIR